jgi:predicted transcriptional regulator
MEATSPVCFKLTAEELRRLDDLAHTAGTTRSEFVRQAIRAVEVTYEQQWIPCVRHTVSEAKEENF